MRGLDPPHQVLLLPVGAQKIEEKLFWSCSLTVALLSVCCKPAKARGPSLSPLGSHSEFSGLRGRTQGMRSMMRKKGMRKVTEAGSNRVTENCKAERAEEK